MYTTEIKMAITKLKHHDKCEVYVQRERWHQTGHYASLHCAEHNTHIQWLHKWDVEALQEMGVTVRPRKLISLFDEAGI